jgi:hypothetical protein
LKDWGKRIMRLKPATKILSPKKGEFSFLIKGKFDYRIIVETCKEEKIYYHPEMITVNILTYFQLFVGIF